MFSGRPVKELFYTLRFRLVIWVAVIVLLMEIITNIAVSQIEERTLQHDYDLYLEESMEIVHNVVIKYLPHQNEQMIAELREKMRGNEHRGLFLQIFDAGEQPIYASANLPSLPPVKFDLADHGPYDAKKHRVHDKKLEKPRGESYYLRCGFSRVALQEDIDLLNRCYLLAGLSTFLIAPLGAYFVALRATRPIAEIIATTAHLQPSNLNERLPIRGTGDEIDQLSMTINGMLDRLASFITQNRDFVANAAHELRSPLAAIRASVEVGLNQGRTDEEYIHILTDVMEETGRLAGLVNRLLILAEGDAGRLAPRDQTTRLDKVVRESVEMFEAVAELKGVRVSIAELAPALVRGDETNLRQVARNLLDNAIKYNRSPGEVDVRLRVDAEKKCAVLIVKDTGIGINREALPRVFERFFRVDKSRTRESEKMGYGLGLSICQAVVEAIKGEISIESEPGKGTTFTVRFPLADDHEAAVQRADKHLPAPAPPRTLAPR